MFPHRPSLDIKRILRNCYMISYGLKELFLILILVDAILIDQIMTVLLCGRGQYYVIKIIMYCKQKAEFSSISPISIL